VECKKAQGEPKKLKRVNRLRIKLIDYNYRKLDPKERICCCGRMRFPTPDRFNTKLSITSRKKWFDCKFPFEVFFFAYGDILDCRDGV
jgi:hypothetical protein